MSKWEFILVFGVNALLSFTALIIGIISYVRVKSFFSRAIETRGVITESVYKGEDSEGAGSMYSPKIKFTDRMGQVHEFTENWSGNRPDYIVGQEAIVFYDPAKPHKARRGGKKWKFYFVAWLCGGLGLLFSSLLIIAFICFFIFGFPINE